MSLRKKFEVLRRDILTQPRDENYVRAEVLKMRQKMKEHLGSSKEQKRWYFSFKTRCRWYRRHRIYGTVCGVGLEWDE